MPMLPFTSRLWAALYKVRLLSVPERTTAPASRWQPGETSQENEPEEGRGVRISPVYLWFVNPWRSAARSKSSRRLIHLRDEDG